MFYGNFVINRKDAAGIITDVFAKIPAAAAQPKRTIFVSVDTQKIYINDGGVWVLIGQGGGGGTPDDTTTGYFAVKGITGHFVNDQVLQSDTNPANPGALTIGSTIAHSENTRISLLTKTGNAGSPTSKAVLLRDSFEVFITFGGAFPQGLVSALQINGGTNSQGGYLKAPQVGISYNFQPAAGVYLTLIGDTDILGLGTVFGINDATSKAYLDNTAHNVSLSIGSTNSVGAAIGISTPIVSDSRIALVDLTNRRLIGGNNNGTFIGANPIAFTGDFINFMINGGASLFGVLNDGSVFSVKHIFNTGTDAIFWDAINARVKLSGNQVNILATNAVGTVTMSVNAGTYFTLQANGATSVGALAGSSAQLNSRAITEQLRLEYDSFNIVKHTVNVAGAYKIDPSGQSISVTKPLILPAYTVGTLPVGVVGMMAYVTDALAPTFQGVAVGGGAVKCSVFYNGANWVTG